MLVLAEYAQGRMEKGRLNSIGSSSNQLVNCLATLVIYELSNDAADFASSIGEDMTASLASVSSRIFASVLWYPSSGP
jgi:hypothetical protein